jgi:hypothetical protein
MVVGAHFWHDYNRQTTTATTLCILPQIPTCLKAESSPIWDEPEANVIVVHDHRMKMIMTLDTLDVRYFLDGTQVVIFGILFDKIALGLV